MFGRNFEEAMEKLPEFGEKLSSSREQIYEIRMRPDGAFEFTGRLLKPKPKEEKKVGR
jgi:hypothetical protein